MAIFVLILFVMMLLFGGIAVDVMRFEMRRVALQETMDRASLSASNVVIPPTKTPQSVAQEWIDMADLGDYITYDYAAPVITGNANATSRQTKITGKVRSYNWFMHMMDVPYFEAPTTSAAQQGEAKVEVIMALDITGSMAEASGSTTKIAALRQAASNFVTILKYNKDTSGNYTIPKDPNNLISIGMVPFSSNVNVPVALRNQFTVSNLSSWNYVANQGVNSPNSLNNCFEINPSTFGTMALSRTTPIPMAAVAMVAASSPGGVSVTAAGAANTNGQNGGIVTVSQANPTATVYNSSSLMCNNGDNPSTGTDESASNLVQLPTTDITSLKAQILTLNPKGNTSIALGFRWASALIDETARPIYTALRGGVPGMSGRPADNLDSEGVTHPDGSKGTRKIIVVMTDGTHVSSQHILNDFKSGPSPIWRGDDGKLAIRYTSSNMGYADPALTTGQRPGLTANTNTCSGWVLAADREWFVPQLKANAVARKVGNQAEGAGTGTSVTGGCDPRAWVAASGTPSYPRWTGSGVVRQLDWSEVWRYASVDWVVEQLYMRSNVAGTSTYGPVYNMFVGNYLTSTANMDALLQTNCTAAKTAGVEVFGIILGNAVTPGPIQNCSSPGTGYFYNVTNANDLNAAFEEIAKILSPLRLTE